MQSAVEWIASLSPWPKEFGLERMRALLADLDNPQRRYPSIHVVGTNGKSTATRTIAALLRADGLRVGAYTSPHVSGWHERLDTDPETFARAIERVRPVADGATQFEVLTAAALLEFAEQGVDVAVVEAGLGGRLDATNVLAARVVLLTNVGLDHTDVLGATREEIAREKLAVVHDGATVVLPDEEFAPLVGHARVRYGGAREAAEAFLGRTVEAEVEVELPGRFERHGDEIWDGAHNVEGVEWLLARLSRDDYTVVASTLRRELAPAMLARLSSAGRRFVATRSSNARAIPAHELASLARPYFDEVLTEPEPSAALERAREQPPVLVTGSLYLLADLAAREEQRVE